MTFNPAPHEAQPMRTPTRRRYNATVMQCRECGEVKPRVLECWPADRGAKDGLRHPCRECRKKYKRAAYKRQSGDPAFRARHSKRNREWARRTQYDRKRNKTLPRKLQRKVAQHRRRWRNVNAGGHCADEDLKRILKSQRGKCFYCGTALTLGDPQCTVDHLTPISKGGTNAPDNIVLACSDCNSRKNDKVASEYIRVLRDREAMNAEDEVVAALRKLAELQRRAVPGIEPRPS